MLPFRDITVSTLAFRTHLRSCYYVLSWSIDLDPTVKIDVLNPTASIPDVANNEAEFNDNSVVLKLTHGNFSALLTGDMGERNEARLTFKNATILDVDILKAGHHGSRTSGSSAFLNAVTPEVVIISLGAGNSYGHPHQEALDRISASGAQYLLRTDIDGTIPLTSDGGGGNYSILTEKCAKKLLTFRISDGMSIPTIALILIIAYK